MGWCGGWCLLQWQRKMAKLPFSLSRGACVVVLVLGVYCQSIDTIARAEENEAGRLAHSARGTTGIQSREGLGRYRRYFVE